MEEVEVLPTSVSVSRGYVQRSCSEGLGEHCIRYHSYLLPKSFNLPNAIALAYGDSFAIALRKGCGILGRRSGPAGG